MPPFTPPRPGPPRSPWISQGSLSGCGLSLQRGSALRVRPQQPRGRPRSSQVVKEAPEGLGGSGPRPRVPGQPRKGLPHRPGAACPPPFFLETGRREGRGARRGGLWPGVARVRRPRGWLGVHLASLAGPELKTGTKIGETAVTGQGLAVWGPPERPAGIVLARAHAWAGRTKLREGRRPPPRPLHPAPARRGSSQKTLGF